MNKVHFTKRQYDNGAVIAFVNWLLTMSFEEGSETYFDVNLAFTDNGIDVLFKQKFKN